MAASLGRRWFGPLIGSVLVLAVCAFGVDRANAALTLRQVLPIGSQETYLAGVKLTNRGGAQFGVPATLKRKLGSGWVCGGSFGYYRKVTWRKTTIIGLSSLQQAPPCRPAQTAVGFVELSGKGQRLLTSRGSIVIGQGWSRVSPKLKAIISSDVVDGHSGKRIIGLGRRQTACGVAPPSNYWSPLIIVRLSGTTRAVKEISVEIPIHEGEDC